MGESASHNFGMCPITLKLATAALDFNSKWHHNVLLWKKRRFKRRKYFCMNLWFIYFIQFLHTLPDQILKERVAAQVWLLENHFFLKSTTQTFKDATMAYQLYQCYIPGCVYKRRLRMDPQEHTCSHQRSCAGFPVLKMIRKSVRDNAELLFSPPLPTLLLN